MRLRPTLVVADPARRMIARLLPTGKRTSRGALASRNLVISFVQSRLDALSALNPWWDDEPLRPDELADADAAVKVLRAAHKSDAEIRAWLLCQRARYDLRSLQDGKPTDGADLL